MALHDFDDLTLARGLLSAGRQGEALDVLNTLRAHTTNI